MKKFLGVFDGFKMSKSTLGYSIQMAKQVNAHLVGVFLDEFIYRSYNVYNVLKTVENPYDEIKRLDEKDKQKRDAAVALFEKSCQEAGITFSVHRDKNIALQELKHESMFADLIIINEYETFNKKKESLPTDFIKDLLSDVQCPVLLVPAVYIPVDKVSLLYDGSPSALYAIKMFSYLFNNLLHLPVEVYTVMDSSKTGTHIPDNKLMKEFIKRHFPGATFRLEKGEAEQLILSHLRHHKENEIVVLGAYRRGEISRWFKTSMADVLMKELEMPLFIAHNK
jgi:hypothetical protein